MTIKEEILRNLRFTVVVWGLQIHLGIANIFELIDGVDEWREFIAPQLREVGFPEEEIDKIDKHLQLPKG